MIHTAVTFHTSDESLQKIYHRAEEIERGNIAVMDGRRVLIEGSVYRNIWIETQPMGGEMYAKRDMDAAYNNQYLFLKYQREDGRLPGVIRRKPEGIEPAYSHLQGLSFPYHALNLYYWMRDENREYLALLYDAFSRYDDWLWRTRDTDGDGCLELFTLFDTGEDNSSRFPGAEGLYWGEDAPPVGHGLLPYESMDLMGYSFDTRMMLSEVSRLLENGEEVLWRQKAGAVRQKIRDYLWREERDACYDRDCKNRFLDTLIHNNLRVMYHGAFSQDMAERFVRRHLMNPAEFWTPMPLPSIAANDPLFRNIRGNNWSGAAEGLTYQRAIRAMENYGLYRPLTSIGLKLLEAVHRSMIFTQQYDPFTMEPTGDGDEYGPTALAALEYIARFHGVTPIRDRLVWGALGGCESDYTQVWGEDRYRIVSDGRQAEASINGKPILTLPAGYRAETDLSGNLLGKYDITPII
ncbi:MAG: hypothetical protein E7458_05330 [Ruminococcaceae bacterium]|nr:hypothetical protein [Oscillospiraceae bacterium]